MVESLARAAGERTLEWKAVLQPGASLEGQWQAGHAVRAIRAGQWDVVVLQQGPSSLPESRVLLRRDTARFAKVIRAAGARPALYMVWPARNRSGDFDGVSISYRTAAKDVDGLIIPAGDAWREVWKRDKNAELYGSDGFHPSAEGSYVAALVMYQQLFGKSPSACPPASPTRPAALSPTFRQPGHASSRKPPPKQTENSTNTDPKKGLLSI